MRRETQNIVLFLVGFALASIAVTGVYTRYVKPGSLPWLVISAAVLMALAVAAMVRDVRRGHAESDGGHPHRHSITWLLVVPVVVLIFFAPPALNAGALTGRTVSAPTAVERPFPPLPSDRIPAIPLPQVLMRIAVGPAGGLDNRRISVTGFTMRDSGEYYLAKIVIVCCAADAQLARLRVTGPAAADIAVLPDNSWVRVEGIVPAGQHYSGTSSIPVLDVSAVAAVPRPANAYGP